MRRRALLVPLLLLLCLVAQPLAASAAEVHPDAEAAFLDAINASREADGLVPLVVNDELTGIARAWAHEMDRVDELAHNPDYARQYTGQWQRMGENVGTATWRGADVPLVVERLHQAFMDSPGHRANILGDYNQAGVGVVMADDTMWVTVNFLQGPIPADEPTVQRVGGAGAPPVIPVAPEPPAPTAPAAGVGHFVRG